MSHSKLPVLDDTTFDAEIAASPVPVLVDFGATWCGPCRALEPILEKLAADGAGTVRVVKVDVDDSPKVAAKFGVRGVPTVVAVVDGKERARHTGVASADVFRRLVGSS